VYRHSSLSHNLIRDNVCFSGVSDIAKLGFFTYI
jgi:hypothetical protein